MAEVPDLTVAVESAVHDALAQAIQAISNQHHLQVTKVQVDWMDMSTLSQPAFSIERITVKAFSKPNV